MSTWNDGEQENSQAALLLQHATRNHLESPALSDMRFLTVGEIALIIRVSRMTVRVIGNPPVQAFANLHLIVSKVLISVRRA